MIYHHPEERAPARVSKDDVAVRRTADFLTRFGAGGGCGGLPRGVDFDSTSFKLVATSVGSTLTEDWDVMTCPEDDIRLYARAFYAQYGVRAHALAMDRAAILGACADHEGVEVWYLVAERVAALAAESGRGDLAAA